MKFVNGAALIAFIDGLARWRRLCVGPMAIGLGVDDPAGHSSEPWRDVLFTILGGAMIASRGVV